MTLFSVNLRTTSANHDSFPYESKRVPFIKIDPVKKTVNQAISKTDKLSLLESASDEDIILAAWPGEWSQDIFLLDNREQVIRVFNGELPEFQQIVKTVTRAEYSMGPKGGNYTVHVSYVDEEGGRISTGYRGKQGKVLAEMLNKNGFELSKYKEPDISSLLDRYGIRK